MNMRSRILRLEKLSGIGVADEMTDSELIAGLRALFRAQPQRRWEEELPAMGHGLSLVLAEVRAADTTAQRQGGS